MHQLILDFSVRNFVTKFHFMASRGCRNTAVNPTNRITGEAAINSWHLLYQDYIQISAHVGQIDHHGLIRQQAGNSVTLRSVKEVTQNLRHSTETSRNASVHGESLRNDIHIYG
jgi:hypothetical protein